MKTKQEMDALCEKVIAACIEVHRHLGPGLLERVYHAAIGYVSLSEKPSGLLVNFNELRLIDGLRRSFPVNRNL